MRVTPYEYVSSFSGSGLRGIPGPRDTIPAGFAIKARHESESAMQHKLKARASPLNRHGPGSAMLSGRRLDLLDPSPLDIEIGDIAHGLARLARWNGQTKGAHAFSVAQHCVLVEAIAGVLKPRLDEKFRLAALLHDAPEYVVGDLISPFKAAMGATYKSFEERIQRAIHIRFGLAPELPASVAQLIKKADKIAAYHEATQLAGFSVADARQYFGDPSQLDVKWPNAIETIEPLDTAAAQAAYLEERFAALEGEGARDAPPCRSLGCGCCTPLTPAPLPRGERGSAPSMAQRDLVPSPLAEKDRMRVSHEHAGRERPQEHRATRFGVAPRAIPPASASNATGAKATCEAS